MAKLKTAEVTNNLNKALKIFKILKSHFIYCKIPGRDFIQLRNNEGLMSVSERDKPVVHKSRNKA
jgi:hypothetical protein